MAGGAVNPGAPETPSSGRSIYEGREPADRLFRGRERSGASASGTATPRRRTGRPWAIIFLAIVAVYGLAATAFIVIRTPALAGFVMRGLGRPSSGAKGEPSAPPAMSATSPADPAPTSSVVVVQLRAEAQACRNTILEADRMVARGLARDALARLERRAGEGKDSLDLQLAMARIRFDLGDTKAARDAYASVIRTAPSTVEARIGLAAALLKLGDAEGSLQAAQWALDDGGAGVDGVRIATHAAVGVGQYAVAAGHARVWLQQDPESVEAQDLLGLCHLRLGEYGKASFLLGELIRQGRGTEASYLNLVLAFGQQKQFNDVADLLLRAVQRLDRRSVVAWFGRPDFTVLRENPVVTAVAFQIVEGASPNLALKLPDVSSEIPMERGIGMSPAAIDLGMRRPSSQ